ncbi:MAG: hypothetical protein BAJALOKI3v1_50020 [Promethearchaeota archaeon]|nr:MAG: hypothetical protein BAJALOKI3v1_50020 [Candidatus Lokiarchaeota archaeon]
MTESYDNKILVIEDSDQRISWFKSKGIGNKFCKNVNHGLKEIKKKYNIVFMDFNLKNKRSSYKIAKYISEHKEMFQNVNIIIHSNDPKGRNLLFNLLKHLNVKIVPYRILRNSLHTLTGDFYNG